MRPCASRSIEYRPARRPVVARIAREDEHAAAGAHPAHLEALDVAVGCGDFHFGAVGEAELCHVIVERTGDSRSSSARGRVKAAAGVACRPGSAACPVTCPTACPPPVSLRCGSRDAALVATTPPPARRRARPTRLASSIVAPCQASSSLKNSSRSAPLSAMKDKAARQIGDQLRQLRCQGRDLRRRLRRHAPQQLLHRPPRARCIERRELRTGRDPRHHFGPRLGRRSGRRIRACRARAPADSSSRTRLRARSSASAFCAAAAMRASRASRRVDLRGHDRVDAASASSSVARSRSKLASTQLDQLGDVGHQRAAGAHSRNRHPSRSRRCGR